MKVAALLVLVVLLLAPSIVKPQQCSGSRTYMDYMVSWSAYAGVVQFKVSVLGADEGTWVAVGFSVDDAMPNSDIVIGSVNEDGDYFVEDRWASVRGLPSYDTMQSITDAFVESANGTMEMTFSRPISLSQTTNGEIQDISLGDACRHLLAAWGGSVSKYTSPASFSKHTDTGVIPQLICLHDCKDGITPTSSYPAATSTTTMSPTPSSPPEKSGGGGGLSTVYIIIIAVVGGLIAIAVCLFLVLVCVCICTRQTTKTTTLYELDNAPAPHPAVRRETMSTTDPGVQSIRHTVTIPVNEYNEETFQQEHAMYDTVAPDSAAANNRPDSFYDGTSDPAVIYDQVPEERRTSHLYGQNEDTATTFQPAGYDQYEQMNTATAATKKTKPDQQDQQQTYEHMQYDPIRHLLN